MVLNATLSRNHPMAMIEFRMVLSILWTIFNRTVSVETQLWWNQIVSSLAERRIRYSGTGAALLYSSLPGLRFRKETIFELSPAGWSMGAILVMVNFNNSQPFCSFVALLVWHYPYLLLRVGQIQSVLFLRPQGDFWAKDLVQLL